MTPRLLKIDNALNQMKKLNIIFQGLRNRTEKLYQGLAMFKSDFEDTEKDLKIMMQDNTKKREEFEMRMTSFMNELVQEYEKRFDMVRKYIEDFGYGSFESKRKFKSEGFLNKIKKIFIKDDIEKDKKIAELETRVRQQHVQMKKLLLELKSVIKSKSK